MLDYQHIPLASPHADIQIFDAFNAANSNGTFVGNPWSQWTKPRGRSMCHILCISGGGGGGGGFTAAAAAARGGGGGGGSGSVTNIVLPLVFLPDQLFIQIGQGGLGKASGDGGLVPSDGFPSRVSLYPHDSGTVPTNIFCLGGSDVGGLAAQGASGTSIAAGTAGTGGVAPTIAEMPLAGLGFFTTIAGQNGTAGGAQTGAVGAPQPIPFTGIVTMGGTGGGGVTATGFAGGLITPTAITTLISTYRPGNAGVGEGGPGGVNIWKPFFSFPGMGGGSGNAVVGGNGGNGIYGSGGGGGGGGTTGGRGGAGGHGLVVIICW